MGCVLGPTLQVAAHSMLDAAAATDPLAASGVALGPALLPLIALAASLTAAVAVGSLIVEWLRKPELGGADAVTDPRTAGLLSVGFVSGAASQRWLPATVLQLAADGIVTIVDRRGRSDGSGAHPNDVRLLYTAAAPPAVRWSDGPSETEAGVVVAMFEPALVGGSSNLVGGSSVDVDRVVKQNDALRAVTRDRFAEAAERYREPRPAGRFRTASIGGVLGVVLGFVSIGLGDEASASIAWSATVIGALALGLRVLLPRWIPLNAAGLLLRERSNELRGAIVASEVTNLAAGDRLLPLAVLFDEPAVIRRVAEFAERSDAAPAWYRTTEAFSADRFASCMAVLAAELSQPIRIGAKAPWMGDDSRFGVPMIGDTKGWGGGYFASDGGSGIAGFGDGGGGFDGGGFGGGDGGGGGY